MKIAIALLLLALAGCGSNFGGQEASARSTCSSIAAGTNYDALVLLAVSSRDSGMSESEFLGITFSTCLDNNRSSSCTACMAAVSADVWR